MKQQKLDEEKQNEIGNKIADLMKVLHDEILAGHFTIMGAIYDVYNLNVYGVHLDISLNHRNKTIESHFNMLGFLSFTNEEKQALYNLILSGGLNIMIEDKKRNLEVLKKEILNLEAINNQYYVKLQCERIEENISGITEHVVEG